MTIERTTAERSATRLIRHLAGLLAVAGLLMGCGDMLGVENESDILDEDLNTDLAVDALSTGIAGDFNWAYHYVGYMSAHLADELLHTGSDTGIRAPSEGNTKAVLTWAGRTYDRNVMAIWVAEDGVRRFTEEIFDDPSSEPAVGMAHVYAGYGLLLAADNLCSITVGGGCPLQPGRGLSARRDTLRRRPEHRSGGSGRRHPVARAGRAGSGAHRAG